MEKKVTFKTDGDSGVAGTKSKHEDNRGWFNWKRGKESAVLQQNITSVKTGRMTGGFGDQPDYGTMKNVSQQTETSHTERDQYEWKLWSMQAKFEKNYELKLLNEIKKMKDNSAAEFGKLRNVVIPGLQKEICGLKDWNKFYVHKNNCAKIQIKDLEAKYYDAISELKTVKHNDAASISALREQLKLKEDQCDQISVLMNEINMKYKFLALDNYKLKQKVQMASEYLADDKIKTDREMSAVKLELQETTCKLDYYVKLETDLDKAIAEAAHTQFSNETNSDQFRHGWTYDNLIPVQTQNRLKQFVDLSKRVLELEARSAELNEELFKERDEKAKLGRKLETVTASMELSNAPVSQLLDAIVIRDLELEKKSKEVQELNTKLTSMKATMALSTEEMSTVEAQVNKMIDHKWTPFNMEALKSKNCVQLGSKQCEKKTQAVHPRLNGPALMLSKVLDTSQHS